MSGDYKKIAEHYDNCLKAYGDTPKGMDWPNIEGMIARYKVMADLVKTDNPCNLLDLGCGTGTFYHYLRLHRPNIRYIGSDINNEFIQLCKKKYPTVPFHHADILSPGEKADLWTIGLGSVTGIDYVVMNGVFTMKVGIKQEAMLDFLAQMLLTVWPNVNVGMAFNVMSDHVDWKRDDLFHLSHDLLASFILNKLGTRNYILRNDYGLYEYTAYVYK